MNEIKNNPRFWSNKFWSSNHINDIVKEVIEPDAVDVDSIQMHNTLNPLIWDGDVIKTEVRKILLMNAKRFIEFSDVENLKFNDIILTGSMANFNFNENSDLDVHIILDFNQISANKNFVGDYLKLKKQLWSETLDPKVKGHDVEMYFQDEKEPHHSTGTYSLIKNKWIHKPLKKIINLNMGDIQLKAADLMNKIEELEKSTSSPNFIRNYDSLKSKIKKYRQTGLDSAGEYSTENLVFKILRNTGYLKRMVDLKNNYLNKELSINELIK